jgi:hypothetical protein
MAKEDFKHIMLKPEVVVDGAMGKTAAARVQSPSPKKRPTISVERLG